MPITPTYPGVYIEEIPSGVRTITGVATSITAFVGYTVSGPVDKAVRILNLGDYERTFGGLHIDSEVSYAVQQFFLNGGSEAYVVRVVKDAASAQVTLKDLEGTEVLTVSAANSGTWGNRVRLDVDYVTNNPDSTFNLTVTRYDLSNGKLTLVVMERHRNLSMNSASATYAPNVVNSASKLIYLERFLNLSFGKGFSLSGKLAPFPSLGINPTITGVLDGTDPFTLILTSSPKTVADLVTALDNAIKLEGLSDRLVAESVDALGIHKEGGDYAKLTSQKCDDRSAVQITAAPANDAAPLLKLGLANGGREKEGAGFHRPAPNGAFSTDLANLMGTSIKGALKIEIKDCSSTSPATIASGPSDLQDTNVGPSLRDKLQESIRAIKHPAAQQAKVQLAGTFLQVIPSADTPNASIDLTLPGITWTPNVQEYSLGVGATFGAQQAAEPGKDGSPPTDANVIIGNYDKKTGLYALREVDLFNLLVIPRTTLLSDEAARELITKAIVFCEERRAFFIIDPPPTKTLTDIGDWASGVSTSKNAAVFFPRIQIADPLDEFRIHDKPASGAMAGIFARTDVGRGVWKAPAGIDAVVRGAQGLKIKLTDTENGTLNPLGVNCLRTFPVYGTVVWGARTRVGADQLASEWKYIPVRRLALFIEESLYRGTQWVVFEPNDEPLWAQIRLNLGAFMNNLFRQGAFQGTSPKDAYFVKCDKETTTQNDINLGIVNIVVGFAPLKPAEFVIIKIQQMAGQVAA